MKGLILIMLPIALLNSCASGHYFIPAKDQGANNEVLYYKGIPYIRSTIERTEVSAKVTSRGGRTIAVDLLCFNDEERLAEVNPAKLSATGFDAVGLSAPLRVFTAEEFIRRRNTRNAIVGGAMALVTIGAVIASVEGFGVGAGNAAFDPSLAIWGFGTAANIALNNDAGTPFISDDGLARPHTLMPGEAYRGVVMMSGKRKYQERLELTFYLNGMPHRFYFNGRARMNP